MYLSYDKLEDKDTLDLIEKAKAGFMQNGGIQVMMAQFSALLEISCTMIISFGLLLYLLSCHGTNKEGILGFMDTFWAGLVLLMLLYGYALFGKYLSKEFSKAGMKFFDQNAKLSRENNYYSNEVALNQKMAKDVRLFQMQDTVLEETVSYTHLDVYKRQWLYSTDACCIWWLCQPGRRLISKRCG